MNESLHMYIGSGKILLRIQAGIWRRSVVHGGEGLWDGVDLNTATLALPRRPRKWPRWHLHVYPGSALCRFMRVTLPADLRGEQERQAAAGAQMAYQFGLDSAGWVFTLDAAAPVQDTIVCAVPRAFIEQMHRFAREHQLIIASMRPFASGIWNAFSAGQAFGTGSETNLIAVEDDAFTLFAAAGGALVSINTLRHRREDGLIDREVRRVSAGAASASTVTRVALPHHLHAMAPVAAVGSACSTGNLSQAPYADFRDLVFPFAESAP